MDATEPPRPTTVADRTIVAVFTLAAFLGSMLLFLVQPLAARLLLPIVGGSASLWNTAMVFFQLTLLAGYAFAHTSLARLGGRRHPWLQALVLTVPLVTLPVAVPDGWSLPADSVATLWVLSVLAIMVGLPFFALATVSPTLQMWFSGTSHPRATDPYFLYAAGNIGSVLALVGYPLLLEPIFTLRWQTRIWSGLYVLLVAVIIAASVLARRHAGVQQASASQKESIAWARRARWLAWSFIPSVLMLGVTLHISTDIASFPLLWVAPLLLYLLTFVIAFAGDSDRRVSRASAFVWFGALALGLLTFAQTLSGRLVVLAVVYHLIWFFAAALVSHSRLAQDRPSTGRLTEFYLVVSIGGALGGIFASLVAPMVFSSVLEYPIAVALALVVARRPPPTGASSWLRRGAAGVLVVLFFGVIAAPTQLLLFLVPAALAALVLRGAPGVIIVTCAVLAGGPVLLHAGNDVLQDRSFFGVYTVVERDGLRELVSGTTVHGSQLLASDGDPAATTYYHAAGPVGQVFGVVPTDRVGIVGLGAGSMADYATPGDEYVFFEIDQLVVDIASNEDLFNYLSSAEGTVDIVVDDGRHGLEEWDGSFDVVVIDAFSSDAIPVHLLTEEAMGLYLSRLEPGGTVMVHISNRHFDLRPVLGRLAEAHGATAYAQSFAPDDVARGQGATESVWVAIAPAGTAPTWTDNPRFDPIEPSGSLWTDDYSNLLGALDF